MASLRFDFNSVYDIANITSYGGKRHGILVQLNSNVWVYNKSLFQQAGVAEPTAPGPGTTTWRRRQALQAGSGRVGDQRRADVYPWFWQAGVDYLAPDGKKTLFDSGPARPIWQHVVDLVVRHRPAPSEQELMAEPPTFQAGGFATTVQSSPGFPLTKQIDGKFVWEVMPTPSIPPRGSPPPWW